MRRQDCHWTRQDRSETRQERHGIFERPSLDFCQKLRANKEAQAGFQLILIQKKIWTNVGWFIDGFEKKKSFDYVIGIRYKNCSP